MEEYKGIYYGDDTKQKFYEGGAHFKYSKLYKILEQLAKERKSKGKKEELLYVKKKNKLNRSNDKITRNPINNIDINQFQFNTINNNFNNINYNIKNNYNIFLSINKDSNNNNKIEKNLSLTNQKKEIDSRNRDYNKAFRGKPNTIFKDGLENILFNKKNKLSSSSMKQKNKIQYPINLKRSLPDFNSNNLRTNNNCKYILNKINCNININKSVINNKKKKVHKNDDIKNIIKDITNRIQPNISYNNGNKFIINTERFLPIYEKKSEKKISKNHEGIKKSKKNSVKLFNRIQASNSIKISRKTRNIINKRIIDKNPNLNLKTKYIITSDIFKKFLNNKEKINIKNSNKKIDKNIFIQNISLLEKNKLNNSQFNTKKNDLNKEKNTLCDKKVINLKKREKNEVIKLDNNGLTFDMDIYNKSRNYNLKNSSFQVKNSFNHNYTNNNQMNDSNYLLKNYFKTMINIEKPNSNNKNNNIIILNNSINKTTIQNSILGNKNYINNKTIINNILKENSKKQYTIKPYTNIKPINRIRNKMILNNSIKVKTRIDK